MKVYKTIEHTADFGMEFFGGSRDELFVSAGEGLFDAICDLDEVGCAESFDIEVDGIDIEELLINWLRELLYLHHIKGMLLRKFDIFALDDYTLRAKVGGERFDKNRHCIKREIKAATYHDLKVERKDGMWMSRVIFDV